MSLELSQIEQRTISFLEQAKSIKVIDQSSLLKANEFLLADKQMQKIISDFCDPTIEAANKAHKIALDQKKKLMNPLIEAERIIKPQIGTYLTEQEQIRREAEEKARKEREEAELKKKAEEEELLKKALQAEADGKKEEAEQIINQAELPKPIVIETKIPEKIKLAGTGLRKELKWRVKDISIVPKEYLIITVDKNKIDNSFRILKQNLFIPGIEIFEDVSVVSGFGGK